MSDTRTRNAAGYVSFVLHSHLPCVVNHGRWPHGEDWLYEAAAEPECSYRPAGDWRYPVSFNGAKPPMPRAGIEQILGEAGIEFFFVDTHLVKQQIRFTPYEVLAGDVPIAAEVNGTGDHHPSSYVPYWADTRLRDRYRVSFFTRDAATGIQVWSGEHGYPGESVYLDFHKKRWPGGHRRQDRLFPRIGTPAHASARDALLRRQLGCTKSLRTRCRSWRRSKVVTRSSLR